MSGRYHDDLHEEWHPDETAEEEAWFRAQEAADAQHEAEHGKYLTEFDPSLPSAMERDWNPEASW